VKKRFMMHQLLVAAVDPWSELLASHRLWAAFISLREVLGGATFKFGSLRSMSMKFCYSVPVTFPEPCRADQA
jgi:hypothetical protein